MLVIKLQASDNPEKKYKVTIDDKNIVYFG